jgi:hypothetical protein
MKDPAFIHPSSFIRHPSRRHFLWSGLGFGAMALEGMLRAEEIARSPRSGLPDRPPRAKNVIWLFMRGGFSHLEWFDRLSKRHRQHARPGSAVRTIKRD